jgi:ubiquinone/menaquinone biosynthesis C-methylase UbiE
MSTKIKGILVVVGTIIIVDMAITQNEKYIAWDKTKTLSCEKGVINVGCGSGAAALILGDKTGINIANDPIVKANVDKHPDDTNVFPNFYQVDIGNERLPFTDSSFDVAFCSHVLEHIQNWEFAMQEMSRVADNIVIVLPNPLSYSGWLSMAHVHHFSSYDMDNIKTQFPKTEIYY